MSPWKQVMNNVKLSAKNGAAGGRTVTLLMNAGYTKEEAYTRLNGCQKEIKIDEEYLRKLFSEQDERCYWLGTKINLEDIFIPHHPLAPSVDRLDNEFGYVPDNVVIATRFANRGRCNVKDDFFLDICLPRIKNDIEYNMKRSDTSINDKRTTINEFLK